MPEAPATASLNGNQLAAKVKELTEILDQIAATDAMAVLSMVDAHVLTRPDLRPDGTLAQKLNLHFNHVMETSLWVKDCRAANEWPEALEETCGHG